MIKNFANTETERLFATGKSRRLPSDILRRVVKRLTQLDAAIMVQDLRIPPSNRLEPLGGNRSGQWSVRINDQWRLCFRFVGGDALDVKLLITTDSFSCRLPQRKLRNFVTEEKCT